MSYFTCHFVSFYIEETFILYMPKVTFNAHYYCQKGAIVTLWEKAIWVGKVP